MQHLAIIPDGNRRWAAQHKLETFFGHKKGRDIVRSAISVCIKNSVKYLSFYTFSLENFRRSELERAYLFDLLSQGFVSELPELIKQGVRVRFIGDRSKFPAQLLDSINQAEEKTKHLDVLNLNLLFCYGATAEITQAIKDIARRVKEGLLQIEDITENMVKSSLWTAGIPDPDLIVRTGGARRLSNFLLLQAAYSEFSFLDCFWPEVTEQHLETCIANFENTQRNFGQ